MKEKTKLSKIIALVVCLMLTITMFSSYSFASITEGTDTATITVSGLEAGVKVSAYQLTTVDYNYTLDAPNSTPYAWTDTIKPLVEGINASYVDMETFASAVTTNSADSEAFYDKLAAAIKGGSIAATKTKTSEGELTYPVTTNQQVVFGDDDGGCEMGTYLILVENGYKVYTPVVVNLTPTFVEDEWVLQNQTATVKATDPTIDKEITNSGAITAKDPINYQITADVPKYLESSTSKYYYISDKISDSLTINTDSIKVYGQNGDSPKVELTGDGTDYTLTTDTTRPNNGPEVTFLINFVYDNIKGYEKIIVEYSATIKQDPSIFDDLDLSNSAYLDYTNNPYAQGGEDGDGWQTSGPNPGEGGEPGGDEEGGTKVEIYAYGIEITNKEKGANAITDGGAQFTLTLGSDTLYFKQTSDGKYFISNSGDGATQTLTVGADGTLGIYGLEAGTYTLKQTKAPENYNINGQAETIQIIDEEPDGVIDGQSGSVYSGLEFLNTKGFQLPVTGGIGTTIFAACGIVFIGLGVFLLTASVRKNKNK